MFWKKYKQIEVDLINILIFTHDNVWCHYDKHYRL